MKKDIFLNVRMLVFVLVFGMSVVYNVSGQDETVNGTWILSKMNISWDGKIIDVEKEDNKIFEEEKNCQLIFNNGYFEISRDGILSLTKGTYTTNNGIITMKLTHIHGNSFSFGQLSSLDIKEELKWYTVDEFTALIKKVFEKEYDTTAFASFEKDVKKESIQSYNYYVNVSGNKLGFASSIKRDRFFIFYTKK